jgi:predicted NBD/HSP70 family sugar kinase
VADSTQSVRERNERSILIKLLEAGDKGTTRADLAADLNLSTAAVANLVTGRIASVLDPVRVATGKSGPRPKALRLLPDEGYAVGADFGQSYMALGLYDLHSREIDHRYIDTSSGADATQAFDWMQAQAEEVVGDPSSLVGVGISVAAPVRDVATKPLHDAFAMPDWIGRDPAHEMRERLRWNCKFEADNDANLGAVAELRWGAAREFDNVVFVKWTWGIGAGIILDGRIRRGQGMAGELGHLTVDLDERHREHPPKLCTTCGRHCLQSVASMRALLVDAGIPGARKRENLHPGVERLVKAIRTGDTEAKRALERAGRYLGTALGTIVTLLNPQAVIIGGDLTADDYDLFGPVITDAIRANSRSSAFGDVVVRAGRQTGRASRLGAATWMLDEHLLDYLMRRAEDADAGD